MSSIVSTITSKWQVTIPEVVRKEIPLKIGERIAWEVEGGKLVGRRVCSVSELAGCFKSDASPARGRNPIGDQVEGYVYRLESSGVKPGKTYLFDAEQHNPRTQLDLFKEQPEMVEFLRTASHGQVMLSLFRETFPQLPEGTTLLLD